jgi:DNA-binding transcriptional LysR family regulator
MNRATQISRRLKLRHLNVLLAVAQWCNMARAAEHLAISQPAVSKAIAELENTLGVRLLDRRPQGLGLTLYGRAFLKRSTAIFNDLATSVTELEFLADPTAGELRIGTTVAMAAGLVCTIVDRLSRQYPRLAFRVTVGDLPDLQDRELRERDIDLMIGRLPDAIPADDMATELLLDETAFVVAGTHCPWTRRRKIELAELINEPWALSLPESFPGSLVERAFRARGLAVPQTGMRRQSLEMHNALLATGRFLAILPAVMLHFSAQRLGLKILPVDLPFKPWPIGIVTLKNRTLSPAAQLFIECAREVIRPLARGRSRSAGNWSRRSAQQA